MIAGPIRLAVVGGNRGGAFRGILRTDPDKVVLSAACDLDEAVLARWRETYPGIRSYRRYEDLLEAGCADAVIIATPVALHADQRRIGDRNR
jgi:predicted dehydrogenase